MDLLEVQYILLFCVYALKAGPGGCLEGGAGRLWTYWRYSIYYYFVCMP